MIERINLKREEGWVIVTAMLVMMILLMMGLALAKITDTQSNLSGTERVRETAFNLGEGVLSAQQVILQNNWPVSAPCAGNTKGCGYPEVCTYANGVLTGGVAARNCPTPSELIGVGKAFGNSDISTPGTRFEIQVRDDIGGNASTNPAYNKSVVDAVNTCGVGVKCTWDANNDKKLWVRVDAWSQYNSALTRDKKRSMVALLQLESVPIPFAQNAVTGGSASFSNSGNKTLVAATGTQVVMRCSPYPGSSLPNQTVAPVNAITVSSNAGFAAMAASNAVADRTIVIGSGPTAEFAVVVKNGVVGNVLTLTAPTTITHPAGSPVYKAPPNTDINGNPCQQWDQTGSNPQVNPKAAFISDPNYPPAMTDAEVQRLSQASDVKTYTDTCPNSNTLSDWTGKVVVLSTNNTVLNCVMQTGNNVLNSDANPGFIIIQRGTLNFKSAGIEYHGLVYMQNLMNYGASDPFVIQMDGNPTIYGGIAVDGFGRVQIGSASGNEPSVVFRSSAFTNFSATGAAGLIQNTWRELDPGQ